VWKWAAELVWICEETAAVKKNFRDWDWEIGGQQSSINHGSISRCVYHWFFVYGTGGLDVFVTANCFVGLRALYGVGCVFDAMHWTAASIRDGSAALDLGGFGLFFRYQRSCLLG